MKIGLGYDIRVLFADLFIHTNMKGDKNGGKKRLL